MNEKPKKPTPWPPKRVWVVFRNKGDQYDIDWTALTYNEARRATDDNPELGFRRQIRECVVLPAPKKRSTKKRARRKG